MARNNFIANVVGGLFKGGGNAGDSFGKINDVKFNKYFDDLKTKGMDAKEAATLASGMAKESTNTGLLGGISGFMKGTVGLGLGAVVVNALSNNGIARWLGNQGKQLGAEFEETQGFIGNVEAEINGLNMWTQILAIINAIIPLDFIQDTIDDRREKVATLNDKLREAKVGPYGQEDTALGDVLTTTAGVGALGLAGYGVKRALDKKNNGGNPPSISSSDASNGDKPTSGGPDGHGPKGGGSDGRIAVSPVTESADHTHKGHGKLGAVFGFASVGLASLGIFGATTDESYGAEFKPESKNPDDQPIIVPSQEFNFAAEAAHKAQVLGHGIQDGVVSLAATPESLYDMADGLLGGWLPGDDKTNSTDEALGGFADKNLIQAPELKDAWDRGIHFTGEMASWLIPLGGAAKAVGMSANVVRGVTTYDRTQDIAMLAAPVLGR